METKDFSFNLPQELIAQHPCGERGASRLLVLDRVDGHLEHRMIADLPELLDRGALMVFNDSRVRKARLFGVPLDADQETEFLLLEDLGSGLWRCMAKRAKRQRVGRSYQFPHGIRGTVEAEEGEFRHIRFTPAIDDAYLDGAGHIPLPPYIRRQDKGEDGERYQTVYSRTIGSSAAPTAGLHFTEEILTALDKRGVQRVFVTLHVGLGTFLPVREERIEEHKMHEETFFISEETAQSVENAKAEGRPVIAVGTTSVRTLESAWDEETGRLRRGAAKTSIFIYPGYRFKVVDRLITNFHTPESTLLMLVSAFAGRDRILGAYGTAVEERYRFFSYGDAMYIR